MTKPGINHEFGGATMADKQLADYKVNVPEGVSGEWGVLKFTAPPDEMESAKWAVLGRNYVPGDYTRLYKGRPVDVIMSDTPDEVADHLQAIRQATHGRILINGLGLGVVLRAVLENPAVTHVDVVECEADVLALVAPSYTDPRVEYHHADAYKITWVAGERWQMVWHDIWPTISSDNLPSMGRLIRKYTGRVGWQGCWGRKMCQDMRIQERTERWY